MNENLKQYYEYLKSANADVPDSYESFATTLANEEYSQQYFKYLKDNNFDAPDSYESFSETLGLKKKSPLTDIGQGTGLVSEDLSKPAEVSSQGQQPLPLEVKPIDLVEKYTQGIEIAGVKPERESYFGDLIERMGAGAIGVVTSGPKQTRLAQKLLNIPRNVLKKELSILGISEETAERISSSVPFLKGKELEAGINIATGLWDKIEKTGEFKDIEKKKEELKQSSQRYDQTIGELFKSKQYNKAIGASFLAGAESLPLTLSAMFGGPIALAEIGLYSASEQYDHLKPNDDMAEVEKIANALVNGGLEIVTERLGSANYGKLIKGLYKTAGKQQAEQVIKAGLKNWFKPMFKRFGIYTAPLGEGVEELVNQLGGNITAKYTGEDPNRPLTFGLADAFFPGVAMGSGMTIMAAPAHTMDSFRPKKTKKPVEGEKPKEVTAMDYSFNGKEITKQEAEQLIDEAKDINKLNGLKFKEDTALESRIRDKFNIPTEEVEEEVVEPKVEEESKDAESIGRKTEEGGEQPQGVEQGEEERIRVRNSAQARVEAVKGEEVKPVQETPPFTEREQETKVEQAPPKKQPIVPKSTFKKDSRTANALNEIPVDFTDGVLQFFIGGGKISKDDFIAYSGWGEKDIQESGLGFLLSKNGQKLDVFNEALDNSFGMENAGPMDMINKIIDIVKSNPTRGKMIAEFERRHNLNQQLEPTAEEIAKQEADEKFAEIIKNSGGLNEKAMEQAADAGLISKEELDIFKEELKNENTEREQTEREWADEERRITEELKSQGRGEEVPTSKKPGETKPKRKKKVISPSEDMVVTDDGVTFRGKTYNTIDDVNADFTGDNRTLTFLEQNKLKQLLRESDFDALNAYPKAETKEDLAFDSPLPMDSKEDPNFQPSDLNNAMSLRNIARDLITNMGLKEGAQVRIGRVKKFARKAQGLYFLDNSIMRIGSNSDLRVLTHELGHYIDHYLFNMRDIINTSNYKDVVTANRIKDPALRDITLNNLREKYGEPVVAGVLQRNAINKELSAFLKFINYPPSQRKRVEGIAEFVYNYVVDPETVIKQTPSTYVWFEKLLDNAEPVKNALQQARKSYDLYKQQDPRRIIESHVSREKEDNGFIAGIKKLTRDKVTYSLLDNTLYAEKLAKIWRYAKEGKAESTNDPFLSIKGMLGIDGRVHQWLVYHPYFKKGNDIEIKKDIDGLLQILKPIIGTDKFKGYEDYLIARRDIESYENGHPAFAIERENIAREAVRLFEEQYGKKELEEFQSKLQAYNDALLDFALQSGKLSDEAHAKIKALNRYYVPFKRIFEDYELNKGVRFTKEMLATSAQPIKARKGSKRQLISPFESMIKNTYDILNASERNITNKNMAEALKDIQKFGLEHGESMGLIQEIPDNAIKPFFDIKTNEVRWAATKEAPKGKIITVWEEGKPKYYEVTPEYYDVLYQNEAKVNEAIRILSTPSRWLQAGAIVYDPTFPLRNIPRDQTSAWFYSEYGYSPTDFIRGITSSLKKDDIFQKWLASGADQSFLVASDQMIGKDYVNKRIGRNLKRKFDTYKRNPLLFLQDFSRASEMGTRVGAFKNAYKKTGDVYKAMQEARDISADYGVHGSAMRQISPLFPFLNARAQHLRMTAKAMAQHPYKLLLKSLAITAPAIFNWLLNNDDDESKNLYQSLPTWRRVGLWNVRIPGTDHFFPIPKGFFGVLFGSSVESILDSALKDDDRIVKELPKQLFKEFSPIGNVSEIVPFPIRPQVEMWANKKGYTGRSIIPEAFKDLKPGQQYFESTPEILKEIGSAVGISPLKLDHYIRSFFGGAGIGAVNILDETLQAVGLVDEKPEDKFTTLSRMPVFKAILTERPIGTYSGYVADFYDTLDKIAGINKNVNKYIASEQDDKLKKYLSDSETERLYKFYIGNETNINNFRYILAQVRDLKYATMKDDMMTSDEKQQAIRDLNDIIQGVALGFKDAFDKNNYFELGAEVKDILKTIKEKQSVTRQSIETQKNLYNPHWLQAKETNPEVFNLLKEYDGFKGMSSIAENKTMDEGDLRKFKEDLANNYLKRVKSRVGIDKKRYDSLRKDTDERDKQKRDKLELLFEELWNDALEETRIKNK